MDLEKPHYVYVRAVLLDGKIWKWSISLHERDLECETMIIPNEFIPSCKEEIKAKDNEFYRRFSMLNYPIWVTNEEENNRAFEEGKKIYRNFPIYENYCMGVKPYEDE